MKPIHRSITVLAATLFLSLGLVSGAAAVNKKAPDLSRYKAKSAEAVAWLTLLQSWEDNWSAVRLAPYTALEEEETWQPIISMEAEYLQRRTEGPGAVSRLEAVKSFNDLLAKTKANSHFHAKSIVDGSEDVKIQTSVSPHPFGGALIDSQLYMFTLPVESLEDAIQTMQALDVPITEAIKSGKKKWEVAYSTTYDTASPLSFANYSYSWDSKIKSKFGVNHSNLVKISITNPMAYPGFEGNKVLIVQVQRMIIKQ